MQRVRMPGVCACACTYLSSVNQALGCASDSTVYKRENCTDMNTKLTNTKHKDTPGLKSLANTEAGNKSLEWFGIVSN